ncbi:MAG TPA: hypothetical protein VFH27_07605 [Longimicrobiaceae bacterium]|nr:hypothetical protein [Longimicrobiaceae bacterium]
MTALTLLALLALLTLAFGAVALRLAARLRRQGLNAAPWALTGAAHLLAGGVAAVQTVLAACAFAGGPSGAAFRLYARLHGPLDESRGMLLAGFACALCLLVARRGRERWSAPRTWALLVVCAVIGALAGAGERTFQEHVHYPMVAVTSAATVLALLGALWLALLNDALDYLLWLALALYAVREALDVNLLSVFGWMGVGPAWLPGRAALDWAAACAWAAMLLLAVARDRAAAHGVATPGLFAAVGRSRGRTVPPVVGR